MNTSLFLLISALSVTLHTKKPHPFFEGQSIMHACSGVFIQENKILTASHCVEKASHLWIKTDDNKSYKATVIKLDEKKDLALLYIHDIKHHNIAKAVNDYKKSDLIFQVSNADDMHQTYGTGMIMNIILDNKVEQLVHSAVILGGSSGSGLFDKRGRLIGINVARMGAVSFAVSSKEIEAFLNN